MLRRLSVPYRKYDDVCGGAMVADARSSDAGDAGAIVEELRRRRRRHPAATRRACKHHRIYGTEH
jgi:hypothetical protein